MVQSSSASSEEKNRLFKFDRESGEFIEIHADEIPEDGMKVILENNQDASFALFQVDTYMVWLYHGKDTSTKVKFMSARGITRLRDEILLGGKVVTVDAGSEPLPFQFATGMADPADFDLDTEMDRENFKPAYTGSKEDESYLAQLSLEHIVLLLEQVSTPSGYEREAVIYENELYAIKNIRRKLFGAEIEEIDLVPMPSTVQIESGTYMADSLHPRLFFEGNRLILIELLRETRDAGRKPQDSFFDHNTQP